jgi:predicted nucleotidyltransferase component of viral defense system
VSDRSPQEAYRQLQRLAREQGRNTQELFDLYVHERFLARLAASEFSDRFVLKGGMLLAVLEARRATRDADMLALGIDNSADNIRAVVAEIANVAMADGVQFDTEGMKLTTIREEADYSGIRVTLPAGLGGAELKFALDLSFGDPVDPERIRYPTLLDDPEFSLLGYRVETVLAEKAETMMARGDANTRDRDYGDVLKLSQLHAVEARTLKPALQAVADHRGRSLTPLNEVLNTLPEARQEPWAALRERLGATGLPESFADVVAGVIEFIDPLLDDHTDGTQWTPSTRRWE